MPNKHFALIDSDCVPVTFFELEELWNFSGCEPVDKEPSLPTDHPMEVEMHPCCQEVPGDLDQLTVSSQPKCLVHVAPLTYLALATPFATTGRAHLRKRTT